MPDVAIDCFHEHLAPAGGEHLIALRHQHRLEDLDVHGRVVHDQNARLVVHRPIHFLLLPRNAWFSATRSRSM